MQELSKQELLQLMQDLEPLKQDVRVRIFAVVDNPTPITWRNSFGLVVGTCNGQPLKLWHAIFKYTTRGDAANMSLPTRERLLTAIHHAVNAP